MTMSTSTRLGAALGMLVLLAAAPALAQARYRFTLVDGRVVDGALVGGDAQTYWVQTAQGTFSIPKANVVSWSAVEEAKPAPAPEQPEPEKKKEEEEISTFQQGLGVFVIGYGVPILAALLVHEKDSDADWAFIPVYGPIAWTSTDEDDWGTDGWDYLAGAFSVIQVAGIAAMIYSAFEPAPRKKQAAVTIAPAIGGDIAGLVVGGRF
jgi:hypothetical protein